MSTVAKAMIKEDPTMNSNMPNCMCLIAGLLQLIL